MVQCLRLCTSTAGGMGSIPGQATKIVHALRFNQKKKKKNYRLVHPVQCYRLMQMWLFNNLCCEKGSFTMPKVFHMSNRSTFTHSLESVML